MIDDEKEVYELIGALNKHLPNQAGKKHALMPRLRAARGFWEAGQYRRAADAFREVFDSEPGNPYFSRYWRASCLFQSGSSDELDALLRQQDDHSGIWRFAQALEAFRLLGDTDDARRLLVEADRLEPEFEHYLLRDKAVDTRREVRFDAGPAEPAFGCARLFLPAWRAVPGAAAWARRVLKVPPTGADPDDVPRRFPRDELRALLLRRETWQIGLVPHPDAPRDQHVPMWLFGVVNLSAGEVRALTVIDQPLTETVVWNQVIQSFISPIDGNPARPSTLVVCRREFRDAWEPLLSGAAPEMLLEFLVRTMARPGGGSAQRPRLVEVSDSDYYDQLRPRLEQAGVGCRLADELNELDDLCLRLARSFETKAPSLVR